MGADANGLPTICPSGGLVTGWFDTERRELPGAVGVLRAVKAPPRLLVVESDVVIRLAVAAYLRECGYAVIEAGTTDEATALLQSGTKIDVALIDVEAKGRIDGFGFAQWMRGNAPAGAPARIVLTSGIRRTAQDAAHLCEHGPVLHKPYDHQNLERHIRELLAR